MTKKLDQILTAQAELLQDVVAENLVGLEFDKFLRASALLELVRLTEEYGGYHLEFYGSQSR